MENAEQSKRMRLMDDNVMASAAQQILCQPTLQQQQQQRESHLFAEMDSSNINHHGSNALDPSSLPPPPQQPQPIAINLDLCTSLQQLEHHATSIEEHIKFKTAELNHVKERITHLKQLDHQRKEEQRQRRRRNRKRCSTPGGCDNFARAGGVCKRHGSSEKWYKCQHPDCNRKAQQNKLCCKHGGRRKCQFEGGCDNNLIYKGMCRRHGPRCSLEGCENDLDGKKYCYHHRALEGGFPRHARARYCKVEGCVSQSSKNGMCRSHDRGKDPKRMAEEVEVGEDVICKFNGCRYRARVELDGYCLRHDLTTKVQVGGGGDVASGVEKDSATNDASGLSQDEDEQMKNQREDENETADVNDHGAMEENEDEV